MLRAAAEGPETFRDPALVVKGIFGYKIAISGIFT